MTAERGLGDVVHDFQSLNFMSTPVINLNKNDASTIPHD